MSQPLFRSLSVGLLAFIGCTADQKASTAPESENHPPTIESIELDSTTVLPGEVVSIHVSGTDPDGDELSYFVSGDAYIEKIGLNEFLWYAPIGYGVHEITVTVTDGDLYGDFRYANVIVKNDGNGTVVGQLEDGCLSTLRFDLFSSIELTSQGQLDSLWQACSSLRDGEGMVIDPPIVDFEHFRHIGITWGYNHGSCVDECLLPLVNIYSLNDTINVDISPEIVEFPEVVIGIESCRFVWLRVPVSEQPMVMTWLD